MTNADESRAQRRARLQDEFIQRAEHVQRLFNVPYEDADGRLRGWRNLYQNEGQKVLQWYEEICKPGAMPLAATLEERIEYADKVLEEAPAVH